jgi:hypothetical protein
MAENVSLLEKALARSGDNKAVCGVVLGKESAPKLSEEIDALIAAWPRVQFSVTESTLAEAGIKIRSDTLSRHYRGKCSCRS